MTSKQQWLDMHYGQNFNIVYEIIWQYEIWMNSKGWNKISVDLADHIKITFLRRILWNKKFTSTILTAATEQEFKHHSTCLEHSSTITMHSILSDPPPLSNTQLPNSCTIWKIRYILIFFIVISCAININKTKRTMLLREDSLSYSAYFSIC